MKSALIAAASTLLTAGLAVAAHPQILVTPDQLERLYLGEGGRLAAGKQELTKAGEWTANAE